MGISINTNISATRASQFLASNHQNLQKSLDRLSSGKRITQPADDAGGLAGINEVGEFDQPTRRSCEQHR